MLREKYYAGATIKKIVEECEPDYQVGLDILDALSRTEAPDVVKVVRCKNCKHRKYQLSGTLMMPLLYFCGLHKSWKREDYYCGDGKLY